MNKLIYSLILVSILIGNVYASPVCKLDSLSRKKAIIASNGFKIVKSNRNEYSYARKTYEGKWDIQTYLDFDTEKEAVDWVIDFWGLDDKDLEIRQNPKLTRWEDVK